MQYIQQYFNVYILIIWLSFVVLGVTLGFANKVTVFRNYNDVGIVSLNLLLPLSVGIIVYFFIKPDEQRVGYIFSGILFVGMLLLVLLRSIKDNSNIAYALIAFITKVTLSIFFIIHFINFIAPAGKSVSARNSNRWISLVFLLGLGPLLFGLVREKEGFFFPNKILNRYGVRS